MVPFPRGCRQANFLALLTRLVDLEARAHEWEVQALVREGQAALVEGRWAEWRARLLAEEGAVDESP